MRAVFQKLRSLFFFWGGVLFLKRVPYYVGDLKVDPVIQEPDEETLHVEFRNLPTAGSLSGFLG